MKRTICTTTNERLPFQAFSSHCIVGGEVKMMNVMDGWCVCVCGQRVKKLSGSVVGGYDVARGPDEWDDNRD